MPNIGTIRPGVNQHLVQKQNKVYKRQLSKNQIKYKKKQKEEEKHYHPLPDVIA